MLCLRPALLNVVVPNELSKGIRGLRSPDYAKIKKEKGVDVFPWKSLRDLIPSLFWPTHGWGPLPWGCDYPAHRTPGWATNLNGVTHDDEYWYIAQQKMLWRFPLSHDLNAQVPPPQFTQLLSASVDGLGVEVSPGIRAAYLPKALHDLNLDHFGDIDYHEGKLFVPLEGHYGENKPYLALFSTDLEFKGAVCFEPQDCASWCAVNPLNGFLYSSNSYLTPGNPLFVYRMTVASNTGTGLIGLEGIELLGTFHLLNEDGAELQIAKISGGAFSDLGHLYLVSDVNGIPSKQRTDGGGVMGFDMMTGRRRMYFPIDYEPDKALEDQELEGITVADFGGRLEQPLPPPKLQSPGIPGQLHVLMIDNGAFESSLWFKHFWLESRTEDITKV